MAGALQLAAGTHGYRMCGLTLASCVELPGVAPEVPAASPDAVVAYGPVPETLPGAARRTLNWEAGAKRLLLRVPGVARFLIQDGRETWLEPMPGRGAGDLAVFITGAVLGVLLHQRGRFVVHASALAVNGEAVVFCGPSGSGKSVLAAALTGAGYPLVADEVCCIDTDGERPMVVPDGRRLKLWADTVERLSLAERKHAVVRAGIEKYWVDPTTPSWGEALPLRAVYFLHPALLPDTAGLQPVAPIDAVAALRVNTYRRRLVRTFGQEQTWLEACGRIVKRAGAWHLTREVRYEALPGVVRMLEEHWGR
jgi:hypothetical protein